MVCTLKDSLGNSLKYITYRQEKDEELLKFLVLFYMIIKYYKLIVINIFFFVF